MAMNEVIPSFEESLFNSDLSGLIQDGIEFGIDSIVEDPIFQCIPIVKTVCALGKTAQNIHDRNLLNQTLEFFKAFNRRDIAEAQLNEYSLKLASNPKFAEDELGRVLVLLNSYVDKEKSQILGNLFNAYVNREINWDTFCELSDVTTRIFIGDIKVLIRINNTEGFDINKTELFESYQLDRLLGLGLLTVTDSPSLEWNNGLTTHKIFETSPLGKQFCNFGIYE